jgi:1-acyl-sn-glycerol-3-phosphate acyltransferase
MMDPIFVAISVKPEIFYMAKAELFNNRLLGAILHWVHVFPVQRGRGDTSAVDHAIQTVRSGRVLGIFPEGTRAKDGEPLKPKSGMAVIARQSGGDILPVGIQFTKRKKFRSHVTLRIGSLIPNSTLGFVQGTPHEIKAASRMIMDEISSLAGVKLDSSTPSSAGKEPNRP